MWEHPNTCYFLLDGSLGTYRYLNSLKERFNKEKKMVASNLGKYTALLLSTNKSSPWSGPSALQNHTVLLAFPLKYHAVSCLRAFPHARHSVWNTHSYLFFFFSSSSGMPSLKSTLTLEGSQCFSEFHCPVCPSITPLTTLYCNCLLVCLFRLWAPWSS